MEPQQSSTNAPAWMRSARNRVERQRAGIRTDALPDRAVVESAVYARAQDFNVPGGEGGGEPSAPHPVRTLREAGLLMHRRAEDSVVATGFHPARHTVVVCGRPVQVELSAILLVALQALAKSLSCPPVFFCVLLRRCVHPRAFSPGFFLPFSGIFPKRP